MIKSHEEWMQFCLELAQKAEKKNEVPVGACVVGPEGLISTGYNLRETLQSSLGHAEILAIHKAHRIRKNWRLEDCTLYVTLEPCLMCAGAIVQSRIQNVIFGAYDKKAGAVRSLYQLCEDSRMNHQVNVVEGVLQNECSQMLTNFFKDLRKAKKK
ncbi:MAG: tRNA adenosine(34) deaminase TadA [Pseudobdellovibrionaceae bacterium]